MIVQHNVDSYLREGRPRGQFALSLLLLQEFNQCLGGNWNFAESKNPAAYNLSHK